MGNKKYEELIRNIKAIEDEGLLNDRKNQAAFCSWMKKLIIETCKKPFNENTLSAFIQIASVKSTNQNVVKYIKLLKIENENKFIVEFEQLDANSRGLTSAVKAAINMDEIGGIKNLETIRSFIMNVATATSREEVKGAIQDFELKNIPMIKEGIYSPWLICLKPEFCPIANGATKSYFEELGWDPDGYISLMDFTYPLLSYFSEKNYMLLDSATWEHIQAKVHGKKMNKDVVNVWVEKRNVSDEVKSPEMEYSKYLISPTAGSDGRNTYKFMKKIQEGDIVIHFVDNKFIAGVSIVEGPIDNPFKVSNSKSSLFGRECIRIKLKNFKELTSPIKRQQLLENSKISSVLNEILDSEYEVFFNKKFELNQGCYITQAPADLIRTLNTLYFNDQNNLLPHLESYGKLKDDLINNQKSLNTIFYGPPGTGKTYTTIERAVQIANPQFDTKLKSRIEIKNEYKRLVDLGKIAFTTFHQSMSYEDFVEGIKPVLEGDEGGNIQYEIVPGIFKTICEKAKNIEFVEKDLSINLDKVNFFKMSVGGKARPDIHDYCLSENVIALGYGGDESLEEFKGLSWKDFQVAYKKKFPVLSAEKKFNIQAANHFIQMKIGDTVIVSRGNHVIDAIGIIDSDYFFDDERLADFYHFRKIKWIAKNLNSEPLRFVSKKITQAAIYQFNTSDVKKDAIMALVNSETEEKGNYVLIIDEINRGNVSQIFGELITLIEDDKRLGMGEAIELVLPYSKSTFGVPRNLYLVGTMNTADRSIEALDTALRRRFAFEEMKPDLELLKKEAVFEDPSFKIEEILKKINSRVEKLLSDDHSIGHSYFINVNDLSSLKNVFENKIIPLLQEYFYGDKGKIGLVLGQGFIAVENNEQVFAKFDGYETDELVSKPIYKLKKFQELEDFKAALIELLK